MGAGEEYLLNVSLFPEHGIATAFELPVGVGISPLNCAVCLLVHRIHMLVLGVCVVVLGFSALVEGRDELDTAFVQSQRMAEDLNGIVRSAKGQVL